jgi:hypothetical protein
VTTPTPERYFSTDYFDRVQKTATADGAVRSDDALYPHWVAN